MYGDALHDHIESDNYILNANWLNYISIQKSYALRQD